MKGTADTAALTQEARDVPIPGDGGISPSEGGDLQKGVQDTCGFLYPLLRLPLIFRRPRKRCFAAKNEESTDFTSVLSFLFCHGSAIA